MPRQTVTKIQMPIFSAGQIKILVVHKEGASLVGRYMSAVGRFLETNDVSVLDEFIGGSVVDTSGRQHFFETRPDVLYALTTTEPDIFDQVYRIIG